METSLTAILHEDVKNAPSSLDARTIAKLLPRNYQTLMSELGRQPLHKLGADLVLPLMRLTGSNNGMDYLARELGGVFVLVPEKWHRRPPSEQQLVRTVQEFSEFLQSVTAAYLDGRIKSSELAKATKEGREAIAAIFVLLDLMENEVEGEPYA